MVRNPMGAQDFTVFLNVPTAPEDQPPTCSVGIEGCFLRGKAAGACGTHSPSLVPRLIKRTAVPVLLGMPQGVRLENFEWFSVNKFD